VERGYHGASLEAVAEAAGFSTGAVYSTFKGKADLFLAVLDARIADRTREMERTGASASSVVEHAERLARQFAATTRNERAWSLLVIEFWAYAARDPELRHQFALRHDELKATIARVLSETLARTGERLAFDTDEVAMAATALGNGLTLERLAHPDTTHDQLFPSIAARFMDGLKLKA
jgi:AcrR family transcriptional regulator